MYRSFIISRLRKSRHAGFTLVELLVVIGLSALVGSYLIYILFQAFWQTGRASARAGLSQEALFTLDRLDKDIRECAAPTMHQYEDSFGNIWIGLRKLVSVSSHRHQTWTHEEDPFVGVAYKYRPTNETSPEGEPVPRLHRQDRLGFGTKGLEVPPIENIIDAYTTAERARPLASHLTHFQWEQSEPFNVVTVTLVLSRDDVEGAPLSFAVQRSFSPRNSLRTSTE